MSTLPQSSNAPTPLPRVVPANGHIVCTPDTCFGKPRIDGTRIRVQDVVDWHIGLGQSVDEVLSHFPHLKRADVYAALTYYYDHQEEMDAQAEESRKFVEELRAKQASLLDVIHQKLKDQPELRKKVRKILPDYPLS